MKKFLLNFCYEIMKAVTLADGKCVNTDSLVVVKTSAAGLRGDKKSVSGAQYLELMSEPWELKKFTAAITAAMQKGTARNVRSAEDGDSKNESGE